jgi:uncharacterized protein YbaP (TraB family)
MKKIFLLLPLLCGLLPTQAQTLWTISNGGPAPSYLLLTGPVCPETMKLSPRVKEALGRVGAIAMDYNLYDSKDAAKFQSYSLATADSQRIGNNLSTGDFQSFTSLMKNNGFPDALIQQIYSYKVGMVYYLLLMMNSPCGLMANQGSYETLLRPFAKSKNLDYIVFQNADEYLAEDSRHTNDYWKQNIRYLLGKNDEIKAKLQTEMTFYDRNDLGSLQSLYQTDGLYRLRLKDDITRQHVLFLAAKIDEQVKRKPTFIAIQLSNVLGEPNLFDLLKSKGYVLTPITE